MIEFLKALFKSKYALMVEVLQEQLRSKDRELASKDRQIRQLQAQIDKVLGFNYDRPKIITDKVPDTTPALPFDTLSDVNAGDDAEFVEQMQSKVYHEA